MDYSITSCVSLPFRLLHKPSGRTYHNEFNPPKKPMTDDVCYYSLKEIEKKQTNKQKKGKNNILAHGPFCTLT